MKGKTIKCKKCTFILTAKIHSLNQIITPFPTLIYMNMATLISYPPFIYKYKYTIIHKKKRIYKYASLEQLIINHNLNILY
jgi:hypothetical protein